MTILVMWHITAVADLGERSNTEGLNRTVSFTSTLGRYPVIRASRLVKITPIGAFVVVMAGLF